MSNILYVNNIISQNDIDKILSIPDVLDLKDKVTNTSQIKLNDFDFMEKINLQLENLLDLKKCRFIYNLKCQKNPYIIHVDRFEKQQNYDLENSKICVIPIQVGDKSDVGVISNVKTIYFDQMYYGPEVMFMHGNTFDRKFAYPVIKNYHNYDIKNLGNDIIIDRKFYNEELTHIEYENLFGLSVENVINWKLGDGFIHNINQLHCSNNYKRYGYDMKLWIVVSILMG